MLSILYYGISTLNNFLSCNGLHICDVISSMLNGQSQVDLLGSLAASLAWLVISKPMRESTKETVIKNDAKGLPLYVHTYPCILEHTYTVTLMCTHNESLSGSSPKAFLGFREGAAASRRLRIWGSNVSLTLYFFSSVSLSAHAAKFPVYIHTHNQQLSGNSKVTRLEFLRVVK